MPMMQKWFLKFIGQTVEIMYIGQNGQITQRCIEVRSVHDGVVKAYCLQRQAPRVFRVDNMLAVQPVRQVGHGA